MDQGVSKDRAETVRRLFDEFAELTPEEQAERLAAIDDATLRQEVASLLDAYDRSDGTITTLNELRALLAHPTSGDDPKADPGAAFDPFDPEDPLNLEGERVGRYAVAEYLGGGGMGVVYRARDTRLGRRVALKFLPPHLSAHPEAKERLLREARAASAPDHPNIGTIHEISETKTDVGRASAGQLFIAMAYYAGETLKAKIARGPLPIEEAVGYAIQIAEGLAKAHVAGIVHRDVKPANVIVTEEGVVKIIDFGLAKDTDSTLTRTGVTMGTVAYMSPEQAKGETIDDRTDIWSLGALLYEMLTGQRPFRGAHPQAVIYAILNETPPPIRHVQPAVSLDLKQIIDRTLQKDPADRYESTAEMVQALKDCQNRLQTAERSTPNVRSLLRQVRPPWVAVPSVGMILLIILTLVWFFDRRAKIRWAREEALPEIERLVETSWEDYTEAYQLAEQAEQYIPNDPKLAALMAQSSVHIDIHTEPSGADVYMKEYEAPESEWQHAGITPIDSLRMPIGIFRWKMEKAGYETVLAAASTESNLTPNDLVRVLDEKGSIPEGMVRVRGAETSHGTLDDFFIDQYEVTNEAYNAFIDSGGYRNRDYWQHEFVRDGQVLTWEEAMAAFVDQTGRLAPAPWLAGDYPEGQSDYPVSGISWYEAAAYCQSVGKHLPTGTHWGVARGDHTSWIRSFIRGWYVVAAFSNFSSDSTSRGNAPVPVGHLPSVTSYGAYDMAGNVREWVWNATDKGRLIRGGAWNDNPCMFKILSQAAPFDRSVNNGFRCALYPDPEEIPESVFAATNFSEPTNFYEAEPVPDTIFEVYKAQFAYDETNLNARIESSDESAEDWVHERISVDPAYGEERMVLHLFLPKHITPPYQTVIYFPGVGSFLETSSDDIEEYWEFRSFLSFLVKDGRAVLYPVYEGTFERQDASWIQAGKRSHLYTDYLIKWVKDFKRSVDFLETRPIIDGDKLAYYGYSWGGGLGAIIPAVEDRLQASILAPGSIVDRGRPEANPLNYITRVKVPTLMLNGRFDTIAPLETNIRPMYDLLGTPEEHKALKLYDTDHIPPRNQFIKEVLAWLDRYLGPVH